MSVHVSNVTIKSEWTDYNKHLNMAYYVLVFDQAWEILLEKFNMGESSAKTSGMSTMVVETNTTYDSEVKEGEEVEVTLTYFDHDKKRLHYKLEMIEKKSKKLSSTIEMLSLHVDLNKRKVAEFDEERTKLMDNFINENKAKFKSDNLKFTGKLKNNMEINLLSGALGAEVKGINLKDSSDKNWELINSLMLEHKVFFLETKILLVKNK